jgi:hypothetical protein
MGNMIYVTVAIIFNLGRPFNWLVTRVCILMLEGSNAAQLGTEAMNARRQASSLFPI